MRVYVPGTFDCLHVGHINLFDYAASLGSVWVGLNPDWFCEQYKRRPVYSLEDRMRIIESLRQVDEVIVNAGGYDSKPAILECAPTYIVHGDDWTGKAYMDQLGVDSQWLMNRGITLMHPPYTKGVSTSRIIDKLSGTIRCATCGDPVYYSAPDTHYVHEGSGRGIWCDAVRYDLERGYVNADGESAVNPDRSTMRGVVKP